MAISFQRSGNTLILLFSPESDPMFYNNKLMSDGYVKIKHAFLVTKDMWLEYNEVNENRNRLGINDYLVEELHFAIGQVGTDYTMIDPEVLCTNHTFYFSNEIELTIKMFIAERNIAIIPKIDNLISRDMYIGGKWEEHSGLPEETFTAMLQKFPTSTELTKYATSRIFNCIKDFFPEKDKYELIYDKYMKKRYGNLESVSSISNLNIELAQFSTALSELNILLSSKAKEKQWQEKVQNIILLLYPKYILSKREVLFPGVDGKDKQPDYLLVDTNGFVDIMEIKEPECKVISKFASYRNNYIPSRDFTGAIQQIEKYRYCLTSKKESQDAVKTKLSPDLPAGVEPKFINPQGILLLGRSMDFNDPQQIKDYELIKRQYKNVVDIMTYDDLMQRLNNIVVALKNKINKDKTE